MSNCLSVCLSMCLSVWLPVYGWSSVGVYHIVCVYHVSCLCVYNQYMYIYIHINCFVPISQIINSQYNSLQTSVDELFQEIPSFNLEGNKTDRQTGT